MQIGDLLRKSREAEPFVKAELIRMLNYPADSSETYQIMAEANRISKNLTQNKAEVHAQFALNLVPCPFNCAFCSFAKSNGVFEEEVRLSSEQAVQYAKQFETDDANAILVMTTTAYPFGVFLEISREIRRNLNAQTTLIANVGDQSLADAKRLKDAGYSDVYHALRLREGIDTCLSPDKRKESIHNFQEAGLMVGTCVEPIGP